MKDSKPLYHNPWGEARCPWCHCELYAMAVYHYIKKGALCHSCQKHIKGETITWTSMDGDATPLCNMDLQHLSNVLYYCQHKDYKLTIKYIKIEFKRRKAEPLPYKPYYSEEEEKLLYNGLEGIQEDIYGK